MTISDNLDGRNYKAWEQNPSTRESLRLFTKRKPIDITLSTPGTAEDIVTVSPGLATVNLITNPSCETGDPPTGYSAVRSGALAQDATYYNYGTKSLKITPPNSARGEGVYWDLGLIPSTIPLALSAYMRRGASGAPVTRVELACSSFTHTDLGTISNSRIQVGSSVTCSGSWQRSTLVSPENRKMTIFHISSPSGTFSEDETLTGGTSGSTAVVRTIQQSTTPYYMIVDTLSGNFTPQVHSGSGYSSETITGGDSTETATLTKVENVILTSHNLHMYIVTATASSVAFYVDGVQAEIQEQVTDYCDGAQGHLNWWDGTANASTSRRWKGMSSIRSYRLHTNRDIYLAEDQDVNSSGTNAEDKGEFIPSHTDFYLEHPIYLDKNISFVNVNSGESPRVYGQVWGV